MMKSLGVSLSTMNIELTTKCPLRCPQCYCSLTGGKDIDLETAIYWIKEGAKFGVKEVMLSGGETMCYPHIFEVVSAAKQYCGGANVALSGYNFNQDSYEKLLSVGVTGIFISLNGSTKEINSMTRDGYELAISALDLLNKNKYNNTTINWVMHSSNADDFLNVLDIAEKYNVRYLAVMAVKPDSKKELGTIPSCEQMESVKSIIKSYKGNVKIVVESCFSPMLAMVSETKLFGNMNVGKYKGCGAGKNAFSVNVDGLLSPCRHLEYFESYETLKDYFDRSEILKKIRGLEDDKRKPCKDCRYSDYCRHCLAINSKLHNDIYIGNEHCPIYEEK